MRSQRNPRSGAKQPDLFGGETAAFVPLSGLSRKELEALPLEAFTEEEVAELWADDENEGWRVISTVIENDPKVTRYNHKLEDIWDELLSSTQAIVWQRTPGVSVKKMMADDSWDGLTHKQQREILARAPRAEIVLDADVWDNLDESDREFFIENNDEVQELIEKLVDPLVSHYESAIEPGDDYILDSVDADYFHQWLQENADGLVDLARHYRRNSNEIDNIIEKHAEAGYSQEQVEQAIDEAMRDTDNYDKSVSDEYTGAFWKEVVSSGYLSVDVGAITAPIIARYDMTDEEIQAAIEEINRKTDSAYEGGYSRRNEFSPDNLRKKDYYVERDIEIQNYVDFDPDWDRIDSAVDSILEDVEPEEGGEGEEREEKKEIPPEERVVKTWKDGFQVVELLPKEFVAEGAPFVCPTHGHTYRGRHGEVCSTRACQEKLLRSDESLWMCIGDPAQRFLRTAKKGAGKAWSLRTSSGKRKIAIFADLKPDGSIRRIDQAKGYRNRLPGFEASTAGGAGREGKFKPDEVMKVAEFIADLGVDPGEVNDVMPGMKMIFQKAAEKNREAEKAVKVLREISPVADQNAGEWLRVRFKEENPRGGKCPSCGGHRGGFCA